MSKDVIRVEGLEAGYLQQMVLQEISFTVQAGEMIGIIGPNGAGKSTLLKAIRGLLPFRSGIVTIYGEDIKKLSAQSFARKAAYLQQGLDLAFDYTAREIVMAGRYPYLSWWQRETERDHGIVQACMEYTGIEKLADKPLAAMSGGQRQRVLLAKVLAQQTPILFLDEPATGLDLIYREEIFRFCQELCRAGKTVLMVVHELSLAARFCSRLLLLGNHTLAADGVPGNVLTEANLSTAYDAAIEICQNPLTGHADIFTVAERKAAKHKEVLQVILGQWGTERTGGGEAE